MADIVVFDCWYQGGGSLLNQSYCPQMLNGEPLQYYETRLVTDATSKHIPWWLLVVAFVLYEVQKGRR